VPRSSWVCKSASNGAEAGKRFGYLDFPAFGNPCGRRVAQKRAFKLPSRRRLAGADTKLICFNALRCEEDVRWNVMAHALRVDRGHRRVFADTREVFREAQGWFCGIAAQVSSCCFANHIQLRRLGPTRWRVTHNTSSATSATVWSKCQADMAVLRKTLAKNTPAGELGEWTWVLVRFRGLESIS